MKVQLIRNSQLWDNTRLDQDAAYSLFPIPATLSIACGKLGQHGNEGRRRAAGISQALVDSLYFNDEIVRFVRFSQVRPFTLHVQYSCPPCFPVAHVGISRPTLRDWHRHT